MVQQEFTFSGKGHTEGALLTTKLAEMDEVAFAGYRVDDDGEYMVLCIDAEDPKTALQSAGERVCEDLTQLHDDLIASMY